MDVATVVKFKFRAGGVGVHERRNDPGTYKTTTKKVLDACHEYAREGHIHSTGERPLYQQDKHIFISKNWKNQMV